MKRFLRRLDQEGFYDNTLLAYYSIVSLVGTLFMTVSNTCSKTSDLSNVIMILFSVSLGVVIQNFFLFASFTGNNQNNKEKRNGVRYLCRDVNLANIGYSYSLY